MDKDILKIDTDTRTRNETITLLQSRLSYVHDLGVLDINKIDKIVLGKKTNYNVKIYLNIELQEHFIILFQLLFGSDWRKEANTLLNHYGLGMQYSNRMFDIKVYADGTVKYARTQEVTHEVKDFVLSPKRAKSNN